MSAPATSPLLLFANIDEPGLRTREVYERRGGYSSLRKALGMSPEAVLEQLKASGLRGRGGAGFAMGTKGLVPAQGLDGQVPRVQCRRVRAGDLQGSGLVLQKTPHSLIEGIVIAAYAAGANRSFIYIRGEYVLQADVLDGAVHEAREAGYLGENILGSGHALSLVVHRGAGAYICGEETGLLDSLEGKRGNPRLKPPFPALAGALPGPNADQQRGDALDGTDDHRDGRRGVREARRRDLHRHQARLGLRPRAPSGQLRDRARHPLARDHLRAGRRPPAGQGGQVLVPRRLLSTRAHGRRARRPLRLQLARAGRIDASARARSSSSTTPRRSSRWR